MWSSCFTFNSFCLVPATDKVSKEAEVRRLEEEGFYVGTRPTTSGWNLNRMEHRILKESEKVSWFHLACTCPCLESLTLSYTSPSFDISAVQVFLKHCGKRRNCT